MVCQSCCIQKPRHAALPKEFVCVEAADDFAFCISTSWKLCLITHCGCDLSVWTFLAMAPRQRPRVQCPTSHQDGMFGTRVTSNNCYLYIGHLSFSSLYIYFFVASAFLSCTCFFCLCLLHLKSLMLLAVSVKHADAGTCLLALAPLWQRKIASTIAPVVDVYDYIRGPLFAAQGKIHLRTLRLNFCLHMPNKTDEFTKHACCPRYWFLCLPPFSFRMQRWERVCRFDISPELKAVLSIKGMHERR